MSTFSRAFRLDSPYVSSLPLNRQFVVVFQPKPGTEHARRRRFAVGAHSLHKYVGRKNAETAIQKALRCEADKLQVLLRKHGRIDFYFK